MVMPVQFLTISGWPGSGKSTIADALVEQRGAVKISFGAPVKERVNATDPYVKQQIARYGKEAKHDPRVRKAYQDEGEQVATYYGEDVLVRAQTKNILDALKERKPIVIDDCRRVCEVDFPHALQQLGIGNMGEPRTFVGLTMRVQRPDLPSPEHALEHQLDEHPHSLLLTNDGTREALEAFALKVWDSLPGAAVRRYQRANSVDGMMDELLGLGRKSPDEALASLLRISRRVGLV